jgi:aldehyde:ferredoxin oxidoreductase
MEKKWFGWKGKILCVDLSRKKIFRKKLSKSLAKNYIGCRGINSKLLYDQVNESISPYDPENKLLIGTGPLNGTPVGVGRLSITTKSPRGSIAEGGIGGCFAPELKFAGFDHIIITGISQKPVYIWIDDDEVQIRNATHLWGSTTNETEDLLKEEIGDTNFEPLYIGPGAENLVHSCPILSGHHAGGRAGCGEIMGHKKLKAIVVRGSKGVQVAHPNDFEKLYERMDEVFDLKETMDPFVVSYGIFGSSSIVRTFNGVHQLGTRNFQTMNFEHVQDISAETYMRDFVTKPESCFCCPVPSCGQWFEIKDGPYAGTKGGNLRALAATYGAVLGIRDLPAVLHLHVLCNQLGLDPYCAMYTIAWAMECFEKGVISKEDTDGIELTFGNYESAIELTKKIAYRDGFGNLLAEGAKKASEKIGKGSGKYALEVKGQELEGMPERGLYSAALGVATSEVGPDHTRWYPMNLPNPASLSRDLFREIGFSDDDITKSFQATLASGKGQLVKFLSDRDALIESIPACIFLHVRSWLGVDFKFWRDLLKAGTGMTFVSGELLMAGERIVNIERAFNVREGYRREHDTLPRRMFEEPVPGGYYGPIKRKDMDLMLDEYYEARGWDKVTSIPTKSKLEELSLQDVSEDFKRLGVS